MIKRTETKKKRAPKTKPLPYHRTGLKWIQKRGGRGIVGDDMGLGKTYQTLYYAWQQKIRPTIVVCPAILKLNWEREAWKHFRMRSLILESKKPFENCDLLEIPHVVIINYEILTYWVDWLKKLDAGLLIFDECHYLQNSGTLRTRAAKKLSKSIPKLLAISGTLILSRPSEAYPVLNMLDKTKFPTMAGYGKRYCNPKWTRWGWDYKGASNLRELHQKLKPIMLRRKTKDVAKHLPPLTVQMDLLSLSRKDQYEYDKAASDFQGWLRSQSAGKALKAKKALQLVRTTALLRLVADMKLKMVNEWIDNFLVSGKKLVIMAHHRDIVTAIHAHNKKSAVKLLGGLTPKKKQDAQDRFQNDPNTNLFVGNIKSCGVGIELFAAHHLAFVELAWTPGAMDQAAKRIHRLGQVYPSWIHYLIAVNTIEERLCKLLTKKSDICRAILDGDEEPQGDETTVLDELLKTVKREKLDHSHRIKL